MSDSHNGDGGGNKMVALAVGVIAILAALAIGLFLVSPALDSFGSGIQNFMMKVGLGIKANPTLSIIILAIPLALTLGLIFMGAKALLSPPH